MLEKMVFHLCHTKMITTHDHNVINNKKPKTSATNMQVMMEDKVVVSLTLRHTKLFNQNTKIYGTVIWVTASGHIKISPS